MRYRWHRRPFYSADSGAPAGGTPTTAPQTGAEPGQQTGGVVAGGAPAAASGETKTEKTYTQADIDRMVKERLADEKRRNEAKTSDERKKADEAALVAQAEWQKLAEQRGGEVEALKAQAAQAEQYAKQLNAMIDAQISDWPDAVKKLDPGAKQLDARFVWLESARDLAKQLASVPKAPVTETGKGNAPASATQPLAPTTTGRYRFQNPGDVSW